MLTAPVLNLFSHSNRNHHITLRAFHGTWILLLHLCLIYVLLVTGPSRTSTHRQSEFGSLMQWVSVRVNRSENLSQVSSERSQSPPTQRDAKSVQALQSAVASSRQEHKQMSMPESSQVSPNKNVELVDPFAVPTDISRLDSAQHRYGVEVPKSVAKDAQVPLTPAQQAASDVRTNSPKLTKSELFAQAAGTLECIYQARMANGKIIREPGRWIEVPARSEIGQPTNIFKARFCVRLHQNDAADGNDLTEISAGLRGK